MLDVAYVVGTVAFFAIMRGYAIGCARLGRDATDEEHVS